MDMETLKELGLTNNESLIYGSLLKNGESAAGEISRLTGLHRRTVYDSIERLIEKGLVSFIVKNNKKIFRAASPNRFLEIVKEKEEKLNEILPLMLKHYDSVKNEEEIYFYKGKEGLKTVFEDQIETKKEILILGASPLAYEILQFYFKWFDKRRKENKIHVKIIFNENTEKINIPLSEIRFLPNKYSSPLAVNIYGEKVAIILWSKENPFAIVIKNKEISLGYKKYFELLWKIAK
ncbi:hypothetical protein J4405_02455 [Candidatus Woesearchaeota archaeon]|nr:hypothetical protein [Candidatus Woesearchaeota archaeon]